MDKQVDSAMLIIDMLNNWDFPDAERLLPAAARIAPRIAALARRCRAAEVPVIYANDNDGRWRSNMSQIVAAAMAGQGQGAEIARLLEPQDSDSSCSSPSTPAFRRRRWICCCGTSRSGG